MPENVGGIGISVEADLGPLRRSLSAATSEVQTFGARTSGASAAVSASFSRISSSARPLSTAIGQAGTALSQAARKAKAAAADFIDAAGGFDALGQRLQNVGTSLSLRVTAPIVAASAGVVKLASDFETAFAGVRKTVDASEATLQGLRQGILDLSKEVPSSANAIAEVAEAAGQLGVETSSILEFSRTVIGLGQATNLAATEAATGLARFANISGTSQSDFDRLGSTIVDLGNNFATTESEILTLGLRLAAAGRQVGFTEAQTLGLGAALSSLGVEAEAGGSALSKTLLEIQAATQSGGKELEAFAALAGQSADEFAKSFGRDAPAAFEDFIAGLRRVQQEGGNVTAALESIGVTEVRQRDALLRLAGAADLLGDAFGTASQAFSENAALTQEVGQRYNTFASQLAILRNEAVAAALPLGEELVGAIRESLPGIRAIINAVGGAARAFRELPTPLKSIAAGLVAGAAAAGPFLVVTGSLVRSLVALRAASLAAAVGTGRLATALRLLGRATVVLGVMTAIFEIVQAYADAAKNAATEQERLNGALGRLGRSGELLTARVSGDQLAAQFAGARVSVLQLEAQLGGAKRAVEALTRSGQQYERTAAGALVETQEFRAANAEVARLASTLDDTRERMLRLGESAAQSATTTAAGLRQLQTDLTGSGGSALSGLETALERVRERLETINRTPTRKDPPLDLGQTKELEGTINSIVTELAVIDGLTTLGIVSPLEAARQNAEALEGALTQALAATGGTITDEIAGLNRELKDAQDNYLNLLAVRSGAGLFEPIPITFDLAGFEEVRAARARATAEAFVAFPGLEQQIQDAIGEYEGLEVAVKASAEQIQQAYSAANLGVLAGVNGIRNAIFDTTSALLDFSDGWPNLAEAASAAGRGVINTLKNIVAEIIAATVRLAILRLVFNAFSGGGGFLGSIGDAAGALGGFSDAGRAASAGASSFSAAADQAAASADGLRGAAEGTAAAVRLAADAASSARGVFAGNPLTLRVDSTGLDRLKRDVAGLRVDLALLRTPRLLAPQTTTLSVPSLTVAAPQRKTPERQEATITARTTLTGDVLLETIVSAARRRVASGRSNPLAFS